MPVDRRRATRLLAAGGAAALLVAGVAVASPAHAAGTKSLPFSSCGPAAKAQVTDLTVTPYPLRAGRKVALTVRGSLSERVTGGAYDVRVSYLDAALLRVSGDLADVAHLPLPAGSFSLHKKAKVPSQAPAGKYNLTLRATDQNHADLLCISVPFESR
jgi:hypothetical protein